MDFIWKFNRSFCLLKYLHRITDIALEQLRQWALDGEHSLLILSTKHGLYVEIDAYIMILAIHVDVHTLNHVKSICLPKERRRKLTAAEKQYVAQIQHYKCGGCAEILTRYEVDHVEQHCCRGNDNITNLIALCPNCHSEKTAREKNMFDAFFEPQIQSRGDYSENILG